MPSDSKSAAFSTMATWKGGPKPPPRVVAPNKLWHAFKHKNLDVFKCEWVAFYSSLLSTPPQGSLSLSPKILCSEEFCVTGAHAGSGVSSGSMAREAV